MTYHRSISVFFYVDIGSTKAEPLTYQLFVIFQLYLTSSPKTVHLLVYRELFILCLSCLLHKYEHILFYFQTPADKTALSQKISSK